VDVAPAAAEDRPVTSTGRVVGTFAALAILLLAAIAFAAHQGDARSKPVVREGFEEPYSFEEVRAQFASDRDGFEAALGVALSLPRVNVSMQSDFFDLGARSGRWSRSPFDRSWERSAPAGTGPLDANRHSTAEALADVGLTVDA